MHRHAVRSAWRTPILALLAVGALCVTMVSALGPAPAASAASACSDDSVPFSDVSASNVHCDNIAWLKAQGITKPADNQYHPESSVTRGSMTAFLFRLTHPGEPSPECTEAPFPDVATDNVFCGYIQWAAKNKIAFGYPDDGDYHPDDPVTRRAMAAFLKRIVDPGPTPDCTSAVFDDVAVDDTFCGVITWLASMGMTQGIGCGYYGPLWPVTRQSMATFLHRAESALQHPGSGPSGSVTIKREPGCTPPQPPWEQSESDSDSGSESDAGDQSETDFGRLEMCPASARACVDLTTSMTWLQDNGTVVYGPVPMSSGRPGYRTRPGTWQVFWKDKDHISQEYYPAPMPNAVFFDAVGIAFHLGDVNVESHGCIHLTPSASQKYWDYLGYGAEVYVFGYAPY